MLQISNLGSFSGKNRSVMRNFRSCAPIGANLAPIGANDWRQLALIGANWRQYIGDAQLAPNWRQFGANYWRQLAPIGAYWRHRGANWRQLLAPIGDIANWRCAVEWKIVWPSPLAPSWRQLDFRHVAPIGANWRQLAMRSFWKQAENLQSFAIGANWRQLAPIGATTADFIVWRCSLVAVCIAWLWVWMYYCNNGWCGFVTMFPLLSLGL